ncbi:MAG: hypothetical protein J7L42_01895 [Elusimicrobia bacterium]|nr:hypothetical protein [Elusimicrobiota bacterium]
MKQKWKSEIERGNWIADQLENDPAMRHYIRGVEYIDSGDKESALKEHRILKQLDEELASDLLKDINECFQKKHSKKFKAKKRV